MSIDIYLMLRERFVKQGKLLDDLSRIPGLIKDRKQKEILQDKDLMTALMFTMLQNSRVREKQEKYDMASLLLYRLLEMIEQRRLAEYNLYVSRMDYTNMYFDRVNLEGTVDEKRICDNLNTIREEMFGKQYNKFLPTQISLLDGYMLLLALGDEISKMRNGRHMDFLKKLRSMVYLRNNSIFAHGLGPVGVTDYVRFRDFVLDVFSKYCELEDIPYAQYSDDVRWYSPLHSLYYTNIGR